MSISVLAASLLLLLVLSAFFALAETSLMALSRIRLRHLVAQGRRRARIIHGLVSRLDHLLATLVLGNTFVNIAFSSVATVLCVTMLGLRRGVIVASVGATAIVLLFGEITPKIAAAQYPERIALWVAPFVRVCVWILGPLVTVITRVSRALLRLTGLHLTARSPLITEEEIRLMIEVGKEEGVLGEQERQMLHRIFEFGDTKVGEVMVAREQMAMVSDRATHDQVLDILMEEGYSRVPVYHGDDPSRIIGVIHAHDILHLWRNQQLIAIPDLIRPVYAVPPETRVSDLLREFQHRKTQIAMVTDPQGRVLGMATLEDLVEEIVGELA